MTARASCRTAVVFVLGSVLLSACAQLFMKASMNELQTLGGAGVAGGYPAELSAWVPVLAWGIAGLGWYAISMMLWIVALSKYELSLAYPMLSLSYVIVYAVAVFGPGFGESVSGTKTAGVLLIVSGVALIHARPQRRTSGGHRGV